VLGFEPSTWPDDKPTFVILYRDDISLQFYVPNPDSPCGSGTISIDTDDARAVHSVVADKVKIGWGPEVYWYGRREFSFDDPDGYAIIISEVTSDPVECFEDSE
jgi:hypothetical protein